MTVDYVIIGDKIFIVPVILIVYILVMMFIKRDRDTEDKPIR